MMINIGNNNIVDKYSMHGIQKKYISNNKKNLV